MSLGILHDLAVGVHPDGADAWALQRVLAAGIHVGAPPDGFNQQGQDWSQPPWRPDALAQAGYAPWRDLVRAVIRHGGGLRIDHILGMFRLWWVTSSESPTEGTYVRYDHEALIGILVLEAARAGIVVVGEDLGTVEPWVRDYLKERGVLGTSVLWFERDADGRPLPPERWRELCLATVTTHDLPPTAGYLAGDHVDLRDRLGLLTRPVAEELAVDEAERDSWLNALRERHLLGNADGDVERIVEALHRYVAHTPAKLVGVALTDAVGERRTQNQPGTTDEYPNWRIPLGGPDGLPILIEDLPNNQRLRRLIGTLSI
jgi:4-alpha-glucanotransferase